MDKLGAGILMMLAVLVASLIIFKNGTSSAELPLPRVAIDTSGQSPVTAAPSKVRVIDGDTIVVDGERLRLFGIDAPEKGLPHGRDCPLGNRKLRWSFAVTVSFGVACL